MVLLQDNNWSTNTVLRTLLTLVFILWLASVMSQYDDSDDENKLKTKVKPPPSNIVLEQISLPPTPKVAEESKLAKQLTKPMTKYVKRSSQTPPINKQQISQVYQKLSDKGVDIQIAWPQNINDREAALTFMYQCAGVQFAVLRGNVITKAGHTKVNQAISNDYSEWVRVALGSLSRKEHNWLNAYALTGTPIRLFPRQIDWRLAQYLAQALKGVPLSHFRANYQVTNQSLQLTQIHINEQRITDIWILYKGKC
jgi:hypothetical protein